MKKLLVVLGPTATGKTDLALQLAIKFDGELVACDSRQVYVGLDLGTGKMPGRGKWNVKRGINKWEVGGINIWMYDLVSPKRQYNVADYVRDANQMVEEILKRGKLPIIVGGTGLYLKAFLEGLSNLSIPINQKLRNKLEKLSVGELQERLKALSPTKWEKLNQSDRQNPRRLLRSIEIVSMYGFIRKDKKYDISDKFDVLKIGLTAPRDEIYKKVDLRISSRLDQNMIDEAEKLYETGLGLKRMKQLGLEYGVLADYLDGKIETLDELVKIMQGKIHDYVRRQLTWFKKERDISWFDITDKNFPKNVENEVAKWYDQA